MPNEVNWLAGSVTFYESFWSIGAKFCYWNRVAPDEFYRFISTFISSYGRAPQEAGSVNAWEKSPYQQHSEGKFTAVGADMLCPTERPDFDFRRLARALGEPTRILRQCRIHPLIPYLNGEKLMVQGTSYLHSQLRICPKCAARGFHSVFHQLSWFRHCPLHEAALVDVSVAASSSKLPQQFSAEYGKCLIDRLLKLASARAFTVDSFHFQKNSCLREEQPLLQGSQYEKWLARSFGIGESSTYMPHFHDLGSTLNEPINQISEYLHFQNLKNPGPSRSIAALNARRLSGHVTRSVHSALPSQLKAIALLLRSDSGFLWRTLLELRLSLCRLTGASPKWQARAETNLQSMLLHHRSCQKERENKLLEQQYHSRGFRLRHIKTECFRLTLAEHYQRQWSCKNGVADFEAQELMKLRAAQHMAAFSSLSNTGLIEPATQNIPLLDFVRHVREIEVTCWKPIAPIQAICDDILEAMAVANAWQIYEEGCTHATATLDFWGNSRNPVFELRLLNDICLVVEVGWRTPDHFPEWCASQTRHDMPSHVTRHACC